MSHLNRFGVTLGGYLSGPAIHSFSIVATTNYSNQTISSVQSIGPCVIQAIGASAVANAGLTKTATISLWVDGVKLWNFGTIPSSASAQMAAPNGVGALWSVHTTDTTPITLLPVQIRCEVSYEFKINVENNTDGSARSVYTYAHYLRE